MSVQIRHTRREISYKRKKNNAVVKYFRDYDSWLPSGEEIFKEYHGYGTAMTWRKLRRRLFKRGFVNPRTGKAPSLMGLNFAYWRYVLAHPQEAYEYAKSHPARLTKEFTVSEEAWWENLYYKVHTAIYTEGQRQAWLEKHEGIDFVRKADDEDTDIE